MGLNMLAKPDTPTNPLHLMDHYIVSCNSPHPFHPELWLTSSGAIPTSAWFISHLTTTLGPDIGRHSICSGAAASLTR
jgi:hypothetical protein